MDDREELQAVLEEALETIGLAGDTFGDIAAACYYPVADAGSVGSDPSAMAAALDEVLDILASIRQKASDADWRYDQAEKRLRKTAGL